MHGIDFIKIAQERVMEVAKNSLPNDTLGDTVYLVSYYKEIQNSKGTFAISGSNKAFFEVTYNGDKQEMYVDMYDGKKQVVYKD